MTENKLLQFQTSAQGQVNQAADSKQLMTRMQQQFKEEKNSLEATHKKALTNFKTEANSKDTII